jgi:hypothetical protein
MADVGLGCPEPVFPVRDLDAAAGFYARLGFGIHPYDARYGFAERERLCVHLQRSPELDRFRTSLRSTSRRPTSTSCTRSGSGAPSG